VSQQKIQAIKDGVRRNQVNGLVQALSQGTMPSPPAEPGVTQPDAVVN